MERIINFCRRAERVYCGTEDISELENLQLKIRNGDTDVFRSRRNGDGSSIFVFSLGIANSGSLVDEVDYMRAIELFYPNVFSWRYNGADIEAIAELPMNEELLGIYSRFNGTDNFIKKLRNKLVSILKYRNYVDLTINGVIDDKVLATGSLNKETNLFCVDILHTDGAFDILPMSISGHGRWNALKQLDMRYWVKEINPDFYKEIPVKRGKRHPITDDVFTKYPLAIQNIAKMPKKGNENRFLLASYLLSVHNERDAKHQLDMMLSDDELHHMNYGNCKDQWRAIVSRGYPAPSPKTLIEKGYAESYLDCLDNFGEDTDTDE